MLWFYNTPTDYGLLTENTNNLTINPVMMEHYGNYFCYGQYKYSKKYLAKAELIVRGKLSGSSHSILMLQTSRSHTLISLFYWNGNLFIRIILAEWNYFIDSRSIPTPSMYLSAINELLT